jgi:hypothetical protein
VRISSVEAATSLTPLNSDIKTTHVLALKLLNGVFSVSFLIVLDEGIRTLHRNVKLLISETLSSMPCIVAACNLKNRPSLTYLMLDLALSILAEGVLKLEKLDVLGNVSYE